MTFYEGKENDNDLTFVYDDCDTYWNEISELYSYTEEDEFQINLSNFNQLLQSKDLPMWSELNKTKKSEVLMHVIQVLELSDQQERFKAISWLLYLVQGVYGECEHAEEQASNCRNNCFLLYEHGIFGMVQDMLLMEININSYESAAEKKTNVLSLEDSKMLRSTISILYTMVETMRRDMPTDTDEFKHLRKEFLLELDQGLNEKEPLVIVLFNMISRFCCQLPSPYPMKKILLLTWKLLLTMLGGFEKLQQMKIEQRQMAGMSVLDEDPLQIVRDMGASTPPTNATDLLEVTQGKKRVRRSVLYEFDSDSSEVDMDRNKLSQNTTEEPLFEEEKVTSIDDIELAQTEESKSDESQLVNDEDSPLDETNGVVKRTTGDGADTPQLAPGAMTPMFPLGPPSLNLDAESLALAAKLRKEFKKQLEASLDASAPVIKIVPGLPWVPKARKKDIESFMNIVRQKFIGFPLPGDLTTVAGLPNPTQDSIGILRKHMYTPLSDLQIEREAEISKCPMTLGKSEIIPETVTERLYQAMLPNLPQYMIALLKILLAAAPTAKAKNDSINILSDILPKEMPTTPILSLKLGIDVNRHREIIVKAISGLLLLLLKHFNLSHVYQFEYTSQHLVFANCIPLVLKFFNQNIVAYVTTKNTIPCLEFPACVIGAKPEITSETFESVDSDSSPCWRNLFSSINLLRILNKLVKWKHSRTMMLVVFKSAPILKRALKIRHGMFQLYVLKLLKVQTKFLGRAWRKNNMKTISAIYQKVRHRLNDDWAFGNDLDARPWDFQQEECALRAYVERFNVRRYRTTGTTVGAGSSIGAGINDDYLPVDNNMQNLLNEEVEFPLEFRKSYDVWLEREVYHSSTDWDMLLRIPSVQ